jgi:hypothetical protein
MPQDNIEVRCMVHGPMKYRFDRDWWNCVGYDGEGCGSFLTAETVRDQDPPKFGTVLWNIYPNGIPFGIEEITK